ncbi:MAG: pilin [Sulfuricaulis sp.]|nr:pilin [Sulfuricaulis sp.]
MTQSTVETNGSTPREPPPVSHRQPKVSGFAIASIVLGLSGIIVSWFIVAIPSILAVILGHVSRVCVARSEGRLVGKGLALTGLISGYFMIAAYVAMMFFIVLPEYRDYQHRARVSEANSLAAETRAAIEDAYGRGLRVGADGNLPAEPSALGLAPSTQYHGNFVKSVTYDTTGTITVTMKPDDKLGPIAGRTVVFVPTPSDKGLVWQVSGASTVPKKYLPRF